MRDIPELIDGYQPLVDRLQVPGSASALIEFRTGQAGQGAGGRAEHPTHHLAPAP